MLNDAETETDPWVGTTVAILIVRNVFFECCSVRETLNTKLTEIVEECRTQNLFQAFVVCVGHVRELALVTLGIFLRHFDYVHYLIHDFSIVLVNQLILNQLINFRRF